MSIYDYNYVILCYQAQYQAFIQYLYSSHEYIIEAVIVVNKDNE